MSEYQMSEDYLIEKSLLRSANKYNKVESVTTLFKNNYPSSLMMFYLQTSRTNYSTILNVKFSNFFS